MGARAHIEQPATEAQRCIQQPRTQYITLMLLFVCRVPLALTPQDTANLWSWNTYIVVWSCSAYGQSLNWFSRNRWWMHHGFSRLWAETKSISGMSGHFFFYWPRSAIVSMIDFSYRKQGLRGRRCVRVWYSRITRNIEKLLLSV